MILKQRPSDLITFEKLEIEFLEDFFQSQWLSGDYDSSPYLTKKVVDWLHALDGEIYWELLAKKVFTLVFYFRNDEDACHFKLLWL